MRSPPTRGSRSVTHFSRRTGVRNTSLCRSASQPITHCKTPDIDIFAVNVSTEAVAHPVNASPKALKSIAPLFDSYAQLTRALLGEPTQVCLLDEGLNCVGHTGGPRAAAVVKVIRELGWTRPSGTPPKPQVIGHSNEQLVTALPLSTTDGELLGALCVAQQVAGASSSPVGHASQLALKLKPVLDSLHRELSERQPDSKKVQALLERTAELEWLFSLTGDPRGGGDEHRMLEHLVEASTERLQSAFGVLWVPDKRLIVECARDPALAEMLRSAWEQTRENLLTWAQRQMRPLVVNSVGRASEKLTPCKILSVPVVPDSGRVLGVLAFFNPPRASDYQSRHTFLAHHLGRQSAALVTVQFDLMTGLYSRDGLEQMYGRLPEDLAHGERSVIHLDVDHMEVVNELHGFELGNELIVRIADLLRPPLLPENGLAARISGDRFAVILPDTDTRGAAGIAARIQQAVSALIIGPADSPVEVSVSCGVAALVSMPEGLARALAAAELACKSAKKRGRNRVELYAVEDSSMMRRHEDITAVGRLRSAIRSERLVLYAQRIAPLRDRSLPGGYEILLRLRDPEQGLISLGPLISAAERYQLLPSIDRWVAHRAVQTLAVYRNLLKTRGITLSMNLSGQSVGNEEYTHQLIADLTEANLPPGALSLEITEQAAVSSLARAHEMIQRLAPWNCRFALDDFGTGANSLASLNALPFARVKIDGSFVRDILTNPRSEATVRGVVELARGLRLETVAEYVETEAIAATLRRLGVDYAQGYAFGRPEPLDDILRALADEESQRLHRLYLEM